MGIESLILASPYINSGGGSAEPVLSHVSHYQLMFGPLLHVLISFFYVDFLAIISFGGRPQVDTGYCLLTVRST